MGLGHGCRIDILERIEQPVVDYQLMSAAKVVTLIP